MDQIRLLVVEDEQRLATILMQQFETEGFEVEVAHDGYVAREKVLNRFFDLIILDINIPLINGYDLCREIRNFNKEIPIIMLTALGTPDNKVAGFDAGADDYVLKPFDFRELLARVNVFLRRTDKHRTSEVMELAGLEMDLGAMTVQRAGKRIDLTAKEFALLKVLLQQKGKVLTREFIIAEVWGIDFDPGTNILDVYINYLRNKIDREYKPKLVHTKFGFGFYCNDKEL
jgi:DNA-binding response OmpR family regulator